MQIQANTLKKSIDWSKQISDSTEKIIKRELVKGYEDGASSYDIALELKKSTGFAYERCEIIARTEIMSACNYADYVSYTQNESIIGMEWSATGDSRTRRTHTVANGQKRKKGEAFRVGNSKLLFPCDSSLGAEAKEIVNCRCTLLAIFEGEELESNTPYDEKDVGSQAWLLRQDNLFQTDYLGGNAKQALNKNGFLKLSDINKPLSSIKKDILDKFVFNFNKPEFLDLFKDTPPVVIQSILTEMYYVLDYGIDNNKENLCALNINKNIKSPNDYKDLELFDKIKAKDGEKSRLDIDDAHVKIIDSYPDNSVILIHNHMDGITLSANDLVTLLKRKSVKYVIAIGHNSNIYIIWNDKRKRYNLTQEKWTQIAESSTKKLDDKVKSDIKNTKGTINHTKVRNCYEDNFKELCEHHEINYRKVD